MPSNLLEPSERSKPPAGGSGGGPAFARREHSGADSASAGFPAGQGAGEALQGLSAEVSGCVLTLALAGGPGGGDSAQDAALPALVDPDAAACGAALAALGEMDRGERARAIAGLLRRA